MSVERTLQQKAMETIAAFDHDRFTIEEFLVSAKQMHDITDFRDISTMLKHLIDVEAIRPLKSPAGRIEAWARGAPMDPD